MKKKNYCMPTFKTILLVEANVPLCTSFDKNNGTEVIIIEDEESI